MGSAERKFTLRLMVEIEAYGLPEVHESPIIDKVTREMELKFGGNAHVTKLKVGPSFGNTVAWLPDTPVVEKEVHEVGEVQEVPEVRGEEAAAGAGLRSVPDQMLELRFPFPDSPTEGGTP